MIFILSFSTLCFGQNSWNYFIRNIQEIQLPKEIKTESFNYRIPVSYNDAWLFILSPIYSVNKTKEEVFLKNQGMLIDSSVIRSRNQWTNVNWEKKEKIQLYSSNVSGTCAIIGKITFSKEHAGIIWAFDQSDIAEGTGPRYWLFIYDIADGNMHDYIEIARQHDIGIHKENVISVQSKLDAAGKIVLSKTISKMKYKEVVLSGTTLKSTDSEILAEYPKGSFVLREEQKLFIFQSCEKTEEVSNQRLSKEGKFILAND